MSKGPEKRIKVRINKPGNRVGHCGGLWREGIERCSLNESKLVIRKNSWDSKAIPLSTREIHDLLQVPGEI